MTCDPRRLRNPEERKHLPTGLDAAVVPAICLSLGRLSGVRTHRSSARSFPLVQVGLVNLASNVAFSGVDDGTMSPPHARSTTALEKGDSKASKPRSSIPHPVWKRIETQTYRTETTATMCAERSSRDTSVGPMSGSWRRRISEWLLLTGDRSVVALVITSLFFGFFSSLSILDVVPLLDLQALFYVYSGLITGNFTLITVVVSINQLLLSRELQTPGELRTQIENVIEYRRDVEGAADEIAPVQPLGFLRLLVEATREQAQRLGGFSRNDAVQAGGDELASEATRLTEQMDQIDTLLRESETGTINVLLTLLRTNYAQEINQLRMMKERFEEELSPPVHDSIDEVIDRLQEIDVARQYFKAIYFQQELASLSRILLYVGLPAVAIATATLLVLTLPASEPEAIRHVDVLLPVSLAVGFLPLSILCSYILRTATVTNLTAATLPFTTPEQEQ